MCQKSIHCVIIMCGRSTWSVASIDVLGFAKDVVVRYKSDNASKCIALQLLLWGVVLSNIIFRQMFLVGVTFI